jgi:hypothetical protein
MWWSGRTDGLERYDWRIDVRGEHCMTKCLILAVACLAGASATAQVPASSAPATANGALERIVTGVPFSAESVTAFVQTASDGSHITHTTTAVVARDSSGRTRYSQNLSPLLAGRERVLTIIRDPAAGIRYVIESNEKVARREPIRGESIRAAQPVSPQDAAMKIARQALGSTVEARSSLDRARDIHPDVTALGDQTIEGVAATGAKASAVIPAGQIGNEKPLTFTSEAWYSRELSIVVMSKLSDPVLGDTTFRLTQLRRVEPGSDVFEVPAGYRIVGAGISPEPRGPRK